MLGLKRRKQACGMYITDTHVKLVRIEKQASEIGLVQSISIPVEEGVVAKGIVQNVEALAAQIVQSSAAEAFKGMKVHVSVPVNKSIMRRLSLQAASDEEMRKQIDVEIHSWQFLPFKDFLFDYVPIGVPYVKRDDEGKAGIRKSKEQDMVVFVAAGEMVQQYVDVAKLAGLTPASVELTPLALQRTLLRMDQLGRHGLEPLYAILHIEADEVNLSIYDKGIPVFMRSLHLPSAEPELEMEKYYQNHSAQMLSAEIARMLNYYEYSVAENQTGVQKIYLAGDFRRVQAVAEYLEKAFRGEIQSLPLQQLVPQMRDIPYDYIVPIGLAMKGA